MIPLDTPRVRGEAIAKLNGLRSAVPDDFLSSSIAKSLSDGGDLPEEEDPVQRQEVRGAMASTPDAYSDTRVHFRQRLLDGCHVVLLEDDSEALEVLGQILENLGAKTEQYSDPLELLARSKLTADILISDVSLPHMTGLELIRQLRAQGCSLPVVALTAHDSRRDQLSSLRAGFNIHLTKPLDSELLVATVAALLGRFEV